jgi:hypothetical protein
VNGTLPQPGRVRARSIVSTKPGVLDLLALARPFTVLIGSISCKIADEFIFRFSRSVPSSLRSLYELEREKVTGGCSADAHTEKSERICWRCADY